MSTQQEKLLGIANAIRTKKGTTDLINANNFENEILNLPSGIELSGEELSVVVIEGNVIEGNFGSLSEDNLSVKPYDGTNPCNIIETGLVGEVIKVIVPYNIPTIRIIGTLNGIPLTQDFATTSEMQTFINTNKVNFTDEFTAIRISEDSMATFNFTNLANITKININNFYWSPNTYGANLFKGLAKLKEIDLTSLGKVKFTLPVGMFENLDSILEIDSSQLDLSQATDTRRLYYGCDNIKKIKMPNSTSITTSLETAFTACYNLIEIDCNGFNSTELTNIKDICYLCFDLEKIDFSSIDMSKITSSDMAFRSCNSVIEAYGKTQADCDILNASSEKPANVVFITKDQTELAQSIKDVISLGVAPTNDLESNYNILRGVGLNV